MKLYLTWLYRREENQLPIETKNLDDIKTENNQMFRLKPRVLDNIVGQIILPGQISVIHGKERFPLTAIAHAVAIGGARAGLSSIYLDSGSNFSPQLARAMADGENKVLDQIKIGEVFNLQNLQDLATQSKNMKNIAVIVIDSLTGVLNMSSPPGSKTRQRHLFATLEVLRELVYETNVHLLMTDHTTKNWRTGELRPIGGNVIEHAVDSVINVSTLEELSEGVRIHVERCSVTPNPGGIVVRIGHRGIRSLKAS
jgi:predicted ATP-dependent serine protease